MMNRASFLFFLVFIIQYALDGQSTSAKIDSMLNALPEQRDSNRVKALNAVFWEATSQDISISGQIIMEQVSLSKELQDKKLIAGSTNSLGVYYYYISEIDSAIWAFDTALDLFRELGNTNRVSACLNNLASMANSKGDFDLAIDYGLKSLALKEELNDQEGIANSLFNLGNTWTYMNKYSEGKDYYSRALDIYKKLEDERSVGECYESLASIEDDFGNFREAIELRKIAYRIASVFEDVYQQSLILGNLGQSYSSLNLCDSALIVLKQALPLAYEVGDQGGASMIKRTIGECLSKQGKYVDGLAYINEALEESKEFGFTERLSDDYWYLYEANKRASRYNDALHALEEHMILSDSTRGVETEKIIRDLETKYETAKKDAEITLLNKQTELDATRKRALWSGIVLLAISALSIIYSIIQRAKKKRLILEKEKELEVQKRESTERELEYKQKELTAKVLQLASKNEFLQKLEEEVSDLKSSVDVTVSKTSQRISRMIGYDTSDDQEWEQFGKEFSSIHSSFLERLKEQYGKFSKSEMRLISLLKMNLSSKEIANTLRISDDGVKKARYRLRKKMGINSSIDIQQYLINY